MPAGSIIQQHVASFEKFPPRRAVVADAGYAVGADPAFMVG
jgi:hypothetical protein